MKYVFVKKNSEYTGMKLDILICHKGKIKARMENGKEIITLLNYIRKVKEEKVKGLTNDEFVKEFKILWKEATFESRRALNKIIRDFYNVGDRAEKIINTMQQKEETEIKTIKDEDIDFSGITKAIEEGMVEGEGFTYSGKRFWWKFKTNEL